MFESIGNLIFFNEVLIFPMNENAENIFFTENYLNLGIEDSNNV